MAQPMTLQTHHNPSLFNKDMLLGGLLGLLIPIPGAALITAPIGGILGGLIGKNRLAKENREGKTVGEPSFWNKDTLIGGLIGLALAGIAAFSVGLIGAGATVVTAAAAPAAAPVVLGLGVGAVGAALFGVPILGAYIGGKIGKKRQEREYDEARRQQIVQQLSQNISPEIGQAVEYKMTHDKQWAKQMLEEKLLAAAQERTRQ